MLTLSSAPTAPGADERAWYAHDSGVSGNFTSISASGDYVVAATHNNSIVEYHEGQWRAVPGCDSYIEGNPFGTTSESRNIKAAAVGGGAFWFGPYASQGNDGRYLNGAFSSVGRGTTARVISIASYGSTILMGLNNGRVSVINLANTTSPYRVVGTLPSGHNNLSVSAVAGFSGGNAWASIGSKVYRATNAGSSSVNWTEQVLPGYVSGGVRAISTPDNNSAYFGASIGGVSTLFRWKDGAFDATALCTFSDEDYFSINSLYVLDENNIWLAGSDGKLWFFNGTAASRIDLGSHEALTAMSVGNGVMWVAGNSGQIFSTIPPISEPGTVGSPRASGAAMLSFGQHPKGSRSMATK